MKHNTNFQFLKDLERGQEGVKKVRKLIYNKYGIKSGITDEEETKREHIDLKIYKKQHQEVDDPIYSDFIKKFGYKIEVKQDETANRTGNIYIELWSNVRVKPPNPGAITQCRAHSIWYILKDKFLVFDRAALLSCLITHFYFNTEQAKNWREITCKPSWQETIKEHFLKFHSFIDKFGEINGKIKLNLMPAGVNADVRGVLLNINEIEKLGERIGLIEVIKPSS